jgi:serpin B
MSAQRTAARRRPPSRTIGLIAPLLAAVAACSDPASPGGKSPSTLTELPRALTADERTTVTAGNGFTFELLRAVNARMAEKNVFISPLSASMALGMAMNGAAGPTEAAMRGTLGFAGQSSQQTNEAYRGLRQLLLTLDPSVKIGIANSIWYRTGFPVLPAFVDLSRSYFDAEVTAADFASPATVGRINDWAKAKTEGRIPKVLDALSDDDVMVLMNALYFKGSWRSRFAAANTAPGPFRLDGGGVVQAQLMSQSDMPVKLGVADGIVAGELPYGNGAYVMTILLPPAGTTVDALVASLDVARWDRLIASLSDAEADVALPRFRMDYTDEWSGDVLPSMGMTSGFCHSPTYDFTRLAAPPLGNGLCISMVKQDTFVEVNEEGTEAAAVTTVKITLTSVGSEPTLRVDRPFVFAIRERFSGAVLFIGKSVDPTR